MRDYKFVNDVPMVITAGDGKIIETETLAGREAERVALIEVATTLVTLKGEVINVLVVEAIKAAQTFLIQEFKRFTEPQE